MLLQQQPQQDVCDLRITAATPLSVPGLPSPGSAASPLRGGAAAAGSVLADQEGLARVFGMGVGVGVGKGAQQSSKQQQGEEATEQVLSAATAAASAELLLEGGGGGDDTARVEAVRPGEMQTEGQAALV